MQEDNTDFDKCVNDVTHNRNNVILLSMYSLIFTFYDFVKIKI